MPCKGGILIKFLEMYAEMFSETFCVRTGVGSGVLAVCLQNNIILKVRGEKENID